ncbi:alpha-amylase family glycosyl hydrolase [Escherichia coli]
MRAEVKNIIHFWAGKGVDGFRLDVINLISKDQTFPNDDVGDGRRFYTDGPRIHEFLQDVSRDVFRPGRRHDGGGDVLHFAGALPALRCPGWLRAFHGVQLPPPQGGLPQW